MQIRLSSGEIIERFPRGNKPGKEFKKFRRNTEEDVMAIRKAYYNGDTYATIAARRGLHPNTVGKIIRRESWAYLL